MNEWIEIYDVKDKTPACFGKEKFILNADHIKALLAGKKLYFTVNDDEYAVELYLSMKAMEELTNE